MNARARAARRTIRDQIKNLPSRVEARRARTRPHSLTSHLISSGADPKTAATMAGSLHTVAKRLGLVPLKGRTERTASGSVKRERVVHRYSETQMALIMAAYKPRKVEYKMVADQFRQAA